MTKNKSEIRVVDTTKKRTGFITRWTGRGGCEVMWHNAEPSFLSRRESGKKRYSFTIIEKANDETN